VFSTLSRIVAGRFARNVAILASGTIAAQVISVLSSPILTRLYSPAEFGFFQVFLALVRSVARSVCGGYETAVVLPPSDGAAKKLLGVAIHFAVAFALLVSVFFLFFGSDVLRVLDAPELEGWVLLAPIQLVLMGLFLSFNHYSLRRRRYDVMAKAKVAQAIFLVVVSIGLGLAGAGFWGLIVGFMAGWFAIVAFLAYPNRDDLGFEDLRWDRRSRAVARRYREFLAFGAPGKLLNGMTLEMPVFFLSHLFPATVVGYYSLVVRVADAPLAVLSQSVSKVHLRKVVDLIQREEAVRPYLLRLAATLASISIVPTILLMVAAPDFFAWLFGPAWREAGAYIRILMPAIAVRFVVSTLSSTLGATENVRLAFFTQATDFVLTALVFLIFGPKGDPRFLLTVFAVAIVGLNLFRFSLIWMAAGHPRNIRA
jgi:O-antigen/teichoic acid export membrane protein